MTNSPSARFSILPQSEQTSQYSHKINDWHGCYDGSWKGLITAEAFSHPAKFSHALIRRIYDHALDEGMIRPGDTVLDPFGGVGLGALYALKNGLRWIGVELERKFVDLGAGCDCPGMSREEWLRFYGRWDRVNYRDGRRWCPACVANAMKVLKERPPQASFTECLEGMDGEPLTTAYFRNSGQVPYTGPHHYTGNLKLFARYSDKGPAARLVQGDSRELGEAVAGVGLVVSSPPYAGSNQNYQDGWRYIDPEKLVHNRHSKNREANYGNMPGQLSNLPEGQISALIGSPPFAGNTGGRGEASRNGIDAALFDRHSGGMKGGTGSDPANLDHLPQGDIQAIIGSPPFADSVGSGDPARRGGLYPDPRRAGDMNLTGTYGKTEGQLGGMDGSGFAAVIASPPYEASINQSEAANDTEARIERMRKAGVDVTDQANIGGDNGVARLAQAYGQSPGQLGRDSGETFWSAARLIVEQCARLLLPGSSAIWVVKAYVKNGQIVDFPDQWRQLCEACGFETVHIHRAWLVKRRGVQLTTEGEAVSMDIERKSFFRRLAERKGSPRIDYEVVLCMRKREDHPAA